MLVRFAWWKIVGTTAAMVLAGVFLSACAAGTDAEKPGNSKTFASPLLGFSFEYPASWTGEPLIHGAHENGLILFDASCMKDCGGLLLTLRTKENYDYDYLNRLAGDFELKEFSSEVTEQHEDALRALKLQKPFEHTVTTRGTLMAAMLLPEPIIEKDTLEIFNKKDRIYIFELHPPAAGGAVAGNEAKNIFGRILETFKEIPVQPVQTPAPASGPEFIFDSCGTLERYKKEPFYADFAAKLDQVSRQRTLMQRFEDNGPLGEKDIKQACLSRQGNLLIALASLDFYCNFGGILKYDIGSGTLAYADDFAAQKRLGCASLSDFGRRRGNVIEVKGAFGDAGMFAEGLYHYDYNANTLSMKRICTRETIDEVKGTAKTSCEDF